MLKVTSTIIPHLKEYDDDLMYLSSWSDDMSTLCQEKRLGNMQITNKIKKILAVMNPKDPI